MSETKTISGTGANGVLILGEGLDEPKAHSVLHRAVRRLGLYLDSFLVVQPPVHLEHTEFGRAKWGRDDLVEIITRFRPRAILALGSLSTSIATGLSGDGHNIGLIEGYCFPPFQPSSVLGVVPSFHPAFLRQGAMSHFGCLLQDIGLAIAVAQGGRQPSLAPHLEPPSGYTMRPLATEAWKFLQDLNYNSSSYLAYDIETPYSKTATEEDAEEASASPILSIQFSLAPGNGIFLPWREPFIEIAKRILALPNPKLGWNNWRFDDPRLVSNDIAIGGSVHDLMWAWHHLQPDLPRGLQFAAKFFGWLYPWKHLAAAAAEFYGIVDCDVLQTIAPPLFKALKDAGIWRGYQKHILELEPILSKMSARGVPVSPTRHAEVEAKLKHRCEHGVEDMQTLVPDEAKQLKVFKKKPSVRLPWKPSNVAFRRYALYRGHELPKDYKSGKITFDQLHLKRLYAKTKDPLYKAVLDYRDAATVLDSHLSNWQPGADARVHSTFYYAPATGQLSSKRPNIQNAPKHKSDLFRSIVQAEEGKVLIEFDYKSFHALTLGFEAQDRDYMRLARLDIHSFVTAHLLRLAGREKLLGLADEELADNLSYIKREHKSVRDLKAKRAILGYGFGLGFRNLYNMYKEDFENQTEARKLLELLDSLFPKCKAWRDKIRIQAHEQNYLLSRHGYIRRFWEVLRWDADAVRLVPGGEESEAAIAFLPANDAFGTIKDAILALDSAGLLDRYGFINTVHDSLLFECPQPLAEEALTTVLPVMEAPSPVLDGLVCEVSASVGKSWDKMEEQKRAAVMQGT